ncbi:MULTISPECIES: YbjN domain-containing protein [unclassified Plantactinospora]|uniref:YbjN domain-containing protein n=1 Tax=unclassified Plantactinospora TaxID=2631981 RepID=UPI000D172738|nr:MULTISPECIES: YbjN domain-containing protein [unclassified Plantactinospora]AVT30681.1 YbjN domain-containing protein [Plantactinospora sp. BC1]AVT37505.1 YbjN domain-containing protein [Plantactinospora sp. BB1]
MPVPDFVDASARPGGGRPERLRPLTDELLGSVLGGRGYTCYTDPDGDLVGSWDGNLVYFLRLGEAGEILQIRTMAASRFSVDDVPTLYAFCNAWNRDRLWPKAFVQVNDDGSVRVCGEVVTDLERGVTVRQLDQLLGCGISTGRQMCAAVAELRR